MDEMPPPRTIDPYLPSPRPHGDSSLSCGTSDSIGKDLSLPHPFPAHLSSTVSRECLPLPCGTIPTTVASLRECASHQIHALLARSRDDSVELTSEEEDALDDGFILCDLGVVERKLAAWKRMFPRIKPFFALKCNPDVMVAAVLGQHEGEAGFDCASLAEIKLALQSTNSNGKRCVYANPQRADADLGAALAMGVEALTFDGPEELQKVAEAHAKRCEDWKRRRKGDDTSKDDSNGGMPQPPEMIMRLLVPDSASSVPLGEKFGAPPSKVEPLAEQALALGLPVIGVSFHCGSGCHDPQSYVTAIRLAKEAMNKINGIIERNAGTNIGGHDSQFWKPCSLLDIGGGFPGRDGVGGDWGRFCGEAVAEKGDSDDSETETASKIAAVVGPLVGELFPDDQTPPIHIISEPGRYFVEAAFALCSRIYSIRIEPADSNTTDNEVGRRNYYIAQGVQGLFKDVLLCGETFLPIPLKVDETDTEIGVRAASNNLHQSRISESETLYPSTVHGPSGETFDVVCRDCFLPQLKVGDWLIFDRMGAYTLSIAARSGRLPIQYIMRGNSKAHSG